MARTRMTAGDRVDADLGFKCPATQPGQPPKGGEQGGKAKGIKGCAEPLAKPQ